MFGKLFKSKTKGLIGDLDDDDIEVRKRAVLALGSMGESAVEPLIEALRSKFRLYLGPQDALAAIGEPAVQPLIRVLRDTRSSYQMRFGATSAIAKMSDQANEALMRILRDQAVEPLIETLRKGECKEWLFVVCKALGNIGDSRAVEPLRRALEACKDVRLIQDSAKEALEKIRSKSR